MVHPDVAMQIPYELRYVGPHGRGQTYLRREVAYVSAEPHNTTAKMTHEPAMLPVCEIALMRATATARFDGGRGNELLIHV